MRHSGPLHLLSPRCINPKCFSLTRKVLVLLKDGKSRQRVLLGLCWGVMYMSKPYLPDPVKQLGQYTKLGKEKGRELLALMPVGGTTNDVLSPLEALDYVIKTIPFDHADALKRELLVGAVVNDFTDGVDAKDRVFYGQKPLTFDPISGSLTLSSIPAGMGDQGLLFRFFVSEIH